MRNGETSGNFGVEQSLDEMRAKMEKEALERARKMYGERHKMNVDENPLLQNLSGNARRGEKRRLKGIIHSAVSRKKQDIYENELLPDALLKKEAEVNQLKDELKKLAADMQLIKYLQRLARIRKVEKQYRELRRKIQREEARATSLQERLNKLKGQITKTKQTKSECVKEEDFNAECERLALELPITKMEDIEGNAVIAPKYPTTWIEKPSSGSRIRHKSKPNKNDGEYRPVA